MTHARFLTAAVALAALAGAIGGVAAPPDATAERMTLLRERMVREDIASGGVSDPRVLESLRTTPRHEFVPPPQRHLAYVDMALPIGEKQTISGPFVVAYMTERLEPAPDDRVLEIGTGSGYQAAVLSPLVKTVYSIEINKPLGEKAARTLARLGYRNVETRIGDGFVGWPEHAPFDKIIVTCSPEEIPQPLVDQLAEGGRMIIPVGERYEQVLVLLTKRDGAMVREALVPSLFVPMTGAAEDARRVLPDGTRPALGNGGFEEVLDADVPTAWYYGRQMALAEGDDAPEGRRYLRFENTERGRPAQVFQGFPVDGRAVARLEIALVARAEGVREGNAAGESPAVVVQFFDERRARSSRAAVALPKGTFGWQKEEGAVTVPPWAREAIVLVGMLGAVGRFDVDDVRITGTPR
ncbi:MAG: protein-L-isoaspartate(D-aspartate) O-methyltransferase [Planctomycetaceae bacterium]